MKQHLGWEGVFAVLATPFHDDLSLDLGGLERQVDFCLESEVHGIVAPVVASEFFTLSDHERIQIFQVVAERVDGRLPFVAGVTGVSIPHAVMLAKAAADAGADALVAMPPYVDNGSLNRTYRYYEAIVEAVQLPIMVQNAPEPTGAPMTITQLLDLLQRVPAVEAIKEETPPNPQKVGKLVEGAGERLQAVFGGHGGIYLFNELTRGAKGTMPACQFADVVVQIHNLYVRGDFSAARERFAALQPALIMEKLYGIAFVKECLKRRGIIERTTMRAAEPEMDVFDHKELDYIWQGLNAYLTRV